MKTWDIGDPVDAADINENFQRTLPYGIADGSIAIGDPVFIENYNVQILEPSEDTHNFSGTAGTNYGGASSVVTGGAGGSWQGLIKFDHTLLPSAANLLKAYLLLSSNRISDSGTATIKRVTAAWSELVVTWTTRPAVTATNAVSVNQDEYGNSRTGHYAADITTLLGDIITNGNNGMEVVSAGSTGSHEFYSRDNAAPEKRPRLVVWGKNPNAGMFKKLTDVDSYEERAGYIGLSLVAAGNGDPVYTQREGVIAGLSGLTAGLRYYVQDTGVLGTTPTALYAGFAMSTTTLFVERPKKTLLSQVKLFGVDGTARTARNQMPFLPFADSMHVEHAETTPSDLYLTGLLDELGLLGNLSGSLIDNTSGIAQDTGSAAGQDLTSLFSLYKNS